MELELKQETVQCWETACRTTIEQEETAEMIVPDARPDIFQVVDGETRLLLQRKEPQEGKAEFSGLLKTRLRSHDNEPCGCRSKPYGEDDLSGSIALIKGLWNLRKGKAF